MKEAREGSGVVNDMSWHPIDQVASSQESLIPKTNWEGGVSQEGNACLNKMSVLPFGDAILL